VTSRRDTLAVLGGALMVPVSATSAQAQATLPAGRREATGPPLSDMPLSPRAFGAPLDGAASDSGPLRSAIAAIAGRKPFGGSISIDGGAVLVTAPVDLAHYVTLDFGRAEVQLRPTAAYAIGVGLDEPAHSATISGRLIQLHGRDRTAISVRNGSGFQLLGADLDLKSEGQVGLHVQANDAPLGPYYGLVDNVRINGTGLPGQTGIVLKHKPTSGSICVNRWIFNNLRHVASLETGIDLQGTDGLTIANVNLESCHGSAIRFGHGGRTIRGQVTGAAGTGAFRSAALAGMPLDPSGAVEVLSGPNRGESMAVTTVSASGEVLFPAGFPRKFEIGDDFLFTESKCRSVSVANATYEGGGSDTETAFDFAAGARGCRVQLGMLTMARGNYFRRAIEDLSNTIASRNEVIRVSANLDAADGELWLPVDAGAAGQGGYLAHVPCWIDAVFVTAERGNAGFVEVDVVVRDLARGLTATLTPDSPYAARRIRKLLPANAMLGTGASYAIRIRNRQLRGPERINVEVVVGIL